MAFVGSSTGWEGGAVYTAQPGESATIRAQVAPGRWEDVPRRSEANK